MEFLQEQVRLLAEFLETDYRRIVRWCGLGMAAAAALGWAAAAANPQAVDQIIEQFMMDIMYEIPKDDMIGKVIITANYIEGKGAPTIIMRGSN